MGTTAAKPEQAVKGLMAIETRIIELATERNLGGLRFEWNDGLDFGHLEDPVPLNLYTPDGKTAEAEFPHADLARYPGAADARVETQAKRILNAIAGPSRDTGKGASKRSTRSKTTARRKTAAKGQTAARTKATAKTGSKRKSAGSGRSKAKTKTRAGR